MQNALRKFGGMVLLGLSLAGPAWPQTTAKADDKPNAQADTRALDGIIAMEDANTRVTALLQFLKANPASEKALTAREALVASYAQLGENQLNDNNIEKAVDAFQRAIRALPKQVSDRFFDETVSRIPMAVSTRGYRAESVGLGKLLETRFATEPTRLATLGEFYLTIEASGEAISTLEQAAKLAPEDARLHRALGSAYRMGLRIDEAIASYQLAVHYAPQDRRAFYDLANLYRSQGAYDDAIKLYGRQLEIDPKHSPSLKGIALALTALGKDNEAAAALNKARDLRGSLDEITQDLLLQTQLAFAYLAQNKLRQARQASDAALLIEPRFSWARIAAAEVELAEGKYFEAERHLLAAQKLANFPTLAFTLGKLYLVVEDFDGAADQFAKAFRYSPKDKFTTRLGGIRDVQSDDLRDLLAPEHQAAIFLAESPTTDEIFRIAESLVRVNSKIRETEESKPKAQTENEKILESSARAFVQAEGSRRSFRALFMANKLALAGRALPLAIRLAEQALDLAEVATEAEGSVRDFPNYDRAGRLHVFRGRAHDARGWALFKSGRTKDAIFALSQAVNEYGNLPEAKRALWHLATAHEAAGAHPRALEMYLAAYEAPATKGAFDIQRTVIETIYRKVNGSLNGLDSLLGQPLKQRTNEEIAAMANAAPALPVETAAANLPEPAAITQNNGKVTAADTMPAGPTGPIVTRPAIATRESNAVAANNQTPPPPVTPVTSESMRVGLFNIPVNKNGARNTTNTRVTRPEMTSSVSKSTPPPLTPTVTPQSTAPNTSQNAPQNTEAVPVKELAKTVELPPATVPVGPPVPVSTAKSEPQQSDPVPVELPTETTTAPVEPVKEIVPKVAAAKVEFPVLPATKEPEIKISELVNMKPVNETTPMAPAVSPLEVPDSPQPPAAPLENKAASEPVNIPAVETSRPAINLPTPVRLPALPSDSFSILPLLTNVPPFIEPGFAPVWWRADDAPEPPPAPLAPKPTISAAAVATQASTEPTVTVRYESLPATTPAGDSGHAVTPVTTTRLRRVPEKDPEAGKTESIPPPPATTRQRRVPPPKP